LNATAVAPVKFVPLIVTLVPTGPLAGVKAAIAGAGALTTVKSIALVALPPGVVTLSGPVVAPAGTVARMAVGEITAKLAATPLNCTAVAPVKFVPVIVTEVPTSALEGVKLVIVGGAPFKKAFSRFAVVRWIRESTRPRLTGPGTSSRAQLQDNVPAANTHAPLGAW
jgi:hypothetical protein